MYEFKTKPYDHQLKVWDLSKDRQTFALFMEMGTGKTKVIIDTFAYLYEKGEKTSTFMPNKGTSIIAGWSCNGCSCPPTNPKNDTVSTAMRMRFAARH